MDGSLASFWNHILSPLPTIIRQENPFGGDIINSFETTPEQVQFIINLNEAKLEELFILSGQLDLLDDKENVGHRLAEYIRAVYDMTGRNAELQEESKKNMLDTLRKLGVVTLPLSPDNLNEFNEQFYNALEKKILKWKYPPIEFDPSRKRQQVNDLYVLVELLQNTGILTADVVKVIQEYVGDKNDMRCVSALFLDARVRPDSGIAIQQLHWDNFVEGGGEVALALDLGSQNLMTRVYMGTNVCKSNVNNDNTEIIRKLDRSLMNEPPYNSLDAITSRLSMARLLFTLMYCFVRNNQLMYIEAHCPMLLFDAGSLHSGGSTVSVYPRLFLTFRSAEFRRKMARYIRDTKTNQVDNWFTQRGVSFDSDGKIVKRQVVKAGRWDAHISGGITKRKGQAQRSSMPRVSK